MHQRPITRITIPWNLPLGKGYTVSEHAILYALGSITLGPRSTVSQYAQLCAGSHDWFNPAMPLTKPPIILGADVWVCADFLVVPSVAVGDGAILGVRAVVVRDVASRAIVAGNPACLVGMHDI